MKRILLLTLLISGVAYSHGYENLKTLQCYSRSLPEYPPISNKNWLKPNYAKLHEENAQLTLFNSFKELLRTVGVLRQPAWTPKYFKSLLTKLTRRRELNSKYGKFIKKIQPKLGEQLVIWGDIQGAFHSMVRDLTELNRLGMINKDFKVKKGVYFVFNGDLIDRAPYILETFTLAMKLMEVNPDQVFYVLGNHEAGEQWYEYGLKTEASIRLKEFAERGVPLDREMKRFFKTLPFGLYIKSGNSKDSEFFRISHHYQELDESVFSDFLHEENDARSKIFKLVNKKKSKTPVNIKAAMKGISRSSIYKPTDGLYLLTPEKGITTWTSFSAPTNTYRKLYQFNNDAFVVVTVKDKIDDWTITLHKQDVRVLRGFKQQAYSLVFGQKISSEKQSENKIRAAGTINVGASFDLSKSVAALGQGIKEGLITRFQQENERGGVRGKLLKALIFDDKYCPPLTKKNAAKIQKIYNLDYILTLGTPTTKVLLPDVKAGKLLLLFPVSGSGLFRDSNLSHIINYRASYEEEALSLLEHAIVTLKMRRVALFYQDDFYGRPPMEASRKLLKKHGISEWVEGTYLRNDVNVDNAAKKFLEFNPDLIMFYSVSYPSIELVRKMGINAFVNKKLMGISGISENFGQFLKTKGLDFIASRVVPDPVNSKLPIVRDYRDNLSIFHPESNPNVNALEGYINASILIETLNAIDEPINKDKIIKHIESIKNFDLGGLNLSFDSEIRSFSRNVWIDIPGEKWIKVDVSKFSNRSEK